MELQITLNVGKKLPFFFFGRTETCHLKTGIIENSDVAPEEKARGDFGS